MKASSLFALFCLPGLLLALAGCNYTKPVMYIDLANHSGHSLENLEVKHPTGIFGLPELRNEQMHQHMAPMGTPCKFSVEFDDSGGKHYVNNFDLGAKCPKEIAFEIGAGMSVSQRTAKP
jgi:hypothetical protein